MKKNEIFIWIISIFTVLFFLVFALGSFGFLFGDWYVLLMKLCFLGIIVSIFTLLMIKYSLVRTIVLGLLLIVFVLSFFLFIATFAVGMICGDMTNFVSFMQVDFFIILGSAIALFFYYKFGTLDLNDLEYIKDFFRF